MRTLFVILLSFQLCIITHQQGGRYVVGLGDSFTSGGGSKSYPHIAAGLLNWQVRNFAVGGSKTHNIFTQLVSAGTVLPLATHVVLTIGGNDLNGIGSLVDIAKLKSMLYRMSISQSLNKVVKNAAAEANINYVDTVVSAFLGHEMYSSDPYIDSFQHPTNAVHPNLKGYAKIGQVLAAYLQAN
ncbi:hypothetical protein I4U23_017870 [Adineta vaga]|nr:hypothetical protein I4U23_017870 [Adineta vaga]